MRMVSPQVPNKFSAPLNEFTVQQNTDVIRLKNLLLDEMVQDGSHDAVIDGLETNFIENLYEFGFVVMATHGTPTIVRVPCADTLTMENVSAREGP